MKLVTLSDMTTAMFYNEVFLHGKEVVFIRPFNELYRVELGYN